MVEWMDGWLVDGLSGWLIGWLVAGALLGFRRGVCIYRKVL